MSNRTLSLSLPFGQTMMLSLLFLLLLLGSGEILVRQQFIKSYLTTPSLNGRQRHLEKQWNRLETFAKAGGAVQCIALGNSMVLNAFDPQIFKQSYYTESGQEITCFNFGVDALTPVSANALAQILIEAYHPELLIFGTDARDFAIERGSDETSVITDMAWVQYRLGVFSLEGWLVESSYLYRYRHFLSDLLTLSISKSSENEKNRYGFEPYDIVFPVTTPPDPSDSSYHVQYYYRILKSYTIYPENKNALSQILSKKGKGTAIVVVEMPVPDTYFNFFDNPSTDYTYFINTLKTVTSDYQVPFLETTPLRLIPDDGWMDYSHVNRKGSVYFSKWLGKQLGKAVADGKISLQTP